MTTSPALDSILAKHAEEPPELPRLTVSQAFITYERAGIQLEAACALYKQLPKVSSVQAGNEVLKDFIKAAEAAIKHAARLLEANA